MATRVLTTAVVLILALSSATQASDWTSIDQSQYSARQVLPDPYAAPCPATPIGLVPIKGNLYRYTVDEGARTYSGLVLATSDGVLVIDPARTCTAIRLRDEIKARFHTPVKYVVETHAHFDHIGGAQVFQREGAVVLAQRNVVEPIVGERLPTAIPDRVFDREARLELGGETVVFKHLGPSISDSMSLVYFPKEKALQCTDLCDNHRLPFEDFPDMYYDGWIATLDWVLKQDVETIDVGHVTPGKLADQAALRQYLVDLHRQILALVRDGAALPEIFRKVSFDPEVESWEGFDSMRFLNIEGMYRWVNAHRRGLW